MELIFIIQSLKCKTYTRRILFTINSKKCLKKEIAVTEL